MRSLAVGGFTAAEVQTALHTSGRTVDFRYELLSSVNDRMGDLENVISGEVANDGFAEIKRTAKFLMVEDSGINWLSDRIRPWFRLKIGSGWVEWPLGTFLLSTPKRRINAVLTQRDVEAYDLLLILKDDAVLTRYSVAAATNVITAVGTVLTGAGFTLMNLVATDETLPVAKEWPPGTSKLKIVLDLLTTINYRFYIDPNGVPVAKPYQRPDERGTEYMYSDDAMSILSPDMESEVDYFKVPNQWLAIVSEPDRPPLSSTYTNSNPNSPTSTISRGRTIFTLVENQEATSQAVLDLVVQKAAFEASQVQEVTTASTALMPHHEDQDMIEVRYSKLDGLPRRYVEHSWTMPLEVGAMMTHELRRVVPV